MWDLRHGVAQVSQGKPQLLHPLLKDSDGDVWSGAHHTSILAAESLILEAKFRVWLQPHWRRTMIYGRWILSSQIGEKEPLKRFFIFEILRKVRQIDNFSLSSLLTTFVPAEKCPQSVQATLVESFADLASAAELTFGLHLSLKQEQTRTTPTVKVKAWRQKIVLNSTATYILNSSPLEFK